MTNLREKLLKESFYVMNLIHIRIHCDIVNCKVNLRHYALYALKASELLTEYIILHTRINS